MIHSRALAEAESFVQRLARTAASRERPAEAPCGACYVPQGASKLGDAERRGAQKILGKV